MGKTHFAAEGEVSFKSILFIPAKAPSGMFDDYGNKKADTIKVKRKYFLFGMKHERVPTK